MARARSEPGQLCRKGPAVSNPGVLGVQRRRVRLSCGRSPKRPRLAVTQLRQDVPREAVADLAMARHGLENPRLEVAVPVMLGSVRHQHAAGLFDLFDERRSSCRQARDIHSACRLIQPKCFGPFSRSARCSIIAS